MKSDRLLPFAILISALLLSAAIVFHAFATRLVPVAIPAEGLIRGYDRMTNKLMLPKFEDNKK